MAVLVVIFAGGGVHALIEGDLVPASYLPGWPTYDYLGLYPYKQTLIAQAVMTAVVIVLFVISAVRRRREDRVRAAKTGDSVGAAEKKADDGAELSAASADAAAPEDSASSEGEGSGDPAGSHGAEDSGTPASADDPPADLSPADK